MPAEEVLGVVLAGGGSRRMGFDKSRLELGGRPVLVRAADVLRSACAEVVVSTQPASGWSDPTLRAIPDLRANLGPLAGLEAALAGEVASGRSVFALACDLPLVSADLVRHLLRVSEEKTGCDAVVPSLAGSVQPLCALYRSGALQTIREHLDAGRRAMHDLLGALAVETVVIDSSLPFFRPDLFHNVNRPVDLQVLPGKVSH